MSTQLAVATFVIKRDGHREFFEIGKTMLYIQRLCHGLSRAHINQALLTLALSTSLPYEITSNAIAEKLAKTAARQHIDHPHYGILAARLELAKLNKSTSCIFSDVVKELYNYRDPITGEHRPIIKKQIYDVVELHAKLLNSTIRYSKDRKYNYFSLRILQRMFLLKINDKVVERPQHMLMRVAVSMWKNNIKEVLETYRELSDHHFVPSHFTLKNAGRELNQYQTSFSFTLEPSAEGIFRCLNQAAVLTKFPADVGIGIHDFVGGDSLVDEEHGVSRGVTALLAVFHNAYDNIQNCKPGPVAFYLEIWHKDIYEFMNLKKPHRLPHLHFSILIPDLFMKRLEDNIKWSLMCPEKCPGLSKVYGEEFEKLYKNYEAEHKYVTQIYPQELWEYIVIVQTTTGFPTMLFKDTCNRKSNHQHLGTIEASNMYANMLQYSTFKEIASSHSASLVLSNFIEKDDKTFNYYDLKNATKTVTKCLNQLIDDCHYGGPTIQRSNLIHRPLAIGVQGLADTFQIIGEEFAGRKALSINKLIFETIYFGALEASCELAEKSSPYPSYAGSPISKGILQQDLWPDPEIPIAPFWDWDVLREQIKKYGIKNSLLISLMPTTITSEIMGTSSSVEPYIKNVYRKKLFGEEFLVANERFVYDLIKEGRWTKDIKQDLKNAYGCVTRLYNVSDKIRQVYKSAWTISSREIGQMALGRAPYIDQSQSLQFYLRFVHSISLKQTHHWAWREGLKTGLFKLYFDGSYYPLIEINDEDKEQAERPIRRVDISEIFTTNIENRRSLARGRHH